MEQVIIFVYAKDKEIKVLSHQESSEQHDELIKKGWTHTTSLNPCVWIKYLYDNCEEVHLMDEIKSLERKP